MTNAIKATNPEEVDLDHMTQENRRVLLSALMERHIGPMPVDLPPYNLCLPVRCEEPVAPGGRTTIAIAPNITFKPQKMIIFGTFGYESQTEKQEIKIGWIRKKTIYKTKQKEVFMDRSNWAIENVLVGNRFAFPHYGSIKGDLFGPNGELRFLDITCEESIHIALMVKNNHETTYAPFWGVILGTVVEKRRGLRDPEDLDLVGEEVRRK